MKTTRALLLLMAGAGILVGASRAAAAQAGDGSAGVPRGLALPMRHGFKPVQLEPTGDGPTPENPLVFGRSRKQAEVPATGATAPRAGASVSPAERAPASDPVPAAPAARAEAPAAPRAATARATAGRDAGESVAFEQLREKLMKTLQRRPEVAAEVEVGRRAVRVVSHAPVIGKHPVKAARTPRSEHRPPQWSYEGSHGPEHWAELDPAWSNCGRGKRQSPIDIRGGISVDLPPIRFGYKAVPLVVADDGHTIRADIGEAPGMRVMGRQYRLRQVHFHRPAEMLVDGRRFDMSAHLVHEDDRGHIAVIAVLFEAGDADTPRNPVVQAIWNNLPLERSMRVPVADPVDIDAILPEDRRYYTFMGSLTEPPCTEEVLWMVLRQPIRVPPSQIEILSRLYPMNARPVQPLEGRLIKQSE